MTIEELDSLLDNSNPASRQIWDKVAIDSSAHSIALFSQSWSSDGPSLRFVGLATLVAANDSHYILTAPHVWHEFQWADQLGISLEFTGVDHSYMIKKSALIATGPDIHSNANGWRPDIVFLRIPNSCVGYIEKYRSFYRFPEPDALKVQTPRYEVFLILGAPGQLGTHTQTHASFKHDVLMDDSTARVLPA